MIQEMKILWGVALPRTLSCHMIWNRESNGRNWNQVSCFQLNLNLNDRQTNRGLSLIQSKISFRFFFILKLASEIFSSDRNYLGLLLGPELCRQHQSTWLRKNLRIRLFQVSVNDLAKITLFIKSQSFEKGYMNKTWFIILLLVYGSDWNCSEQ